MQVFDQADGGCNYVDRYLDLSGDGLIAGLGVIALVGVVTLMGDRAYDMDAAGTDEVGGATVGKRGVQVVGDAVVLDHGAIAVGAPVQTSTVAVCLKVVAEKTGQDDTIAELAGGAEQKDLLVDGGRVPLSVGAGPWSYPR